MDKLFADSIVNRLYGLSRGLSFPSDDGKNEQRSLIDMINGTKEKRSIFKKVEHELTPLDLSKSLMMVKANQTLINQVIILENCANLLRNYKGFAHFLSEKGWNHLKEEVAELILAKIRRNADMMVDAVLDAVPLFLGQLISTHHASDWTSYVRISSAILTNEPLVWRMLVQEVTYSAWIAEMRSRGRSWPDHLEFILRLATFVLLNSNPLVHPKLVGFDYEYEYTEYFYPPEFTFNEFEWDKLVCISSAEHKAYSSRNLDIDDNDYESTCCMGGGI